MPTVVVRDPQNILTNSRPNAKIELKKLSTGEFVVLGQTKEGIIKEKYPNLIGQPITISDASEKYDVPATTIREWHKKGYIKVVEPGYQMKLNEADIAYCADIYKDKKSSGIGFRGGPLLDENGLPYQVKHQSLSEYRKRRKSQ